MVATSQNSLTSGDAAPVDGTVHGIPIPGPLAPDLDGSSAEVGTDSSGEERLDRLTDEERSAIGGAVERWGLAVAEGVSVEQANEILFEAVVSIKRSLLAAEADFLEQLARTLDLEYPGDAE